MNQQIADAVRALPPILQEPYALGWIMCLLCVLAYTKWIRPAVWRELCACLSQHQIDRLLSRKGGRLLLTTPQGSLSATARGWLTINRILLPALSAAVSLHALLTLLQYALPTPGEWLGQADGLLLSLLFFAISVLSLITQPRSTIDRRTRWGFRPVGNLVHAVLWEGVIVVLLFLWLYVAYFLALL